MSAHAPRLHGTILLETGGEKLAEEVGLAPPRLRFRLPSNPSWVLILSPLYLKNHPLQEPLRSFSC